MCMYFVVSSRDQLGDYHAVIVRPMKTASQASSFTLTSRACCLSSQSMLAGEKTLIGQGRVRDVWLLDYDGRTVVVKTLRDVGEAKNQKGHFYRHVKEVLILDAVSGTIIKPHLFLESCYTDRRTTGS